MELRHLRALVAVAEELHFGRAARRLHLSPPPVSLAIKELEAEMGVRLFERTSRKIEITVQGEFALREARTVLAKADLLTQRARNAATGSRGSLEVGIAAMAGYSFFPDALKRFTTDFPTVTTALHEASTEQITKRVEAGDLDVGYIMSSPMLAPSLSYFATNTERLVTALPQGHALANLNEVPLEMLASEQFLVIDKSDGPIMFDTIVALCRRSGFSPKLLPGRQMHTIISLVAARLGVALIPSGIQALRGEGVVFRHLRGEQTTIEAGVCWKTDSETPVVRSFLKYLPKVAQV